ncbi:MAG: Rpn family recombination-promoting nuclease/putative transposase [Opitutaceae bacterium]|jgi:hypothetical protein|nr:Rpn family recombination-promoting nuclease/putative transposase [Opitutaceae bacterium]
MTSPDEPSPAPHPAPSAAADAPSPATKAAGNGDHDRIFRHAFSLPAVARQFLRTWLPPELVAQADWHTLTVTRISGIGDTLAERREDVVYRIKVDGRDVHFYVLMEHQTKTEKFMARRILEEILLIWRQDEHDRAEEAKTGKADKNRRESDKLPLVISIVLHPGPRKWGKIWRLADLIDVPPRIEKWARTFMPDCGFIVVELAGLPLEKLADGALARAILGALQGNRLGLMDVRKIRRLLDEIFSDPDRASIAAVVNQLWHYLISHSELKREQTENIVITHIPEEYRSDIMSTVERLRQEGRQEGRLEGEHNSLIGVLDTRFDRVPEGLQEAIRGINDLERLRNLLRVAIRCASIEEFSQKL